MGDFFEGMTSLEQTYWYIALIGSAIFVVLFIVTFIGGHSDIDMDADATDFESDDGGVGYQFFTFKNVVAFFTIFGWTGIICIQHEYSIFLTLLISTLAGVAMMVLTTLLFFYMNRLTQSGTLQMNNALGVVGEVYIPIGKQRSRIGKVQLKVQGRLQELEAITDCDEDLKTNQIVKVVQIVSSDILLVEKLTL